MLAWTHARTAEGRQQGQQSSTGRRVGAAKPQASPSQCPTCTRLRSARIEGPWQEPGRISQGPCCQCMQIMARAHARIAGANAAAPQAPVRPRESPHGTGRCSMHHLHLAGIAPGMRTLVHGGIAWLTHHRSKGTSRCASSGRERPVAHLEHAQRRVQQYVSFGSDGRGPGRAHLRSLVGR